jgi:hypothetical protein
MKPHNLVSACLCLILLASCGAKKEEGNPIASYDASISGLENLNSMASMAAPEVGQSLSYKMPLKPGEQAQERNCQYEAKKVQKTILAKTTAEILIKKTETLTNSFNNCPDKIVSKAIETKYLKNISDIGALISEYVKGFRKASAEGSCQVNVSFKNDQAIVTAQGNCDHKDERYISVINNDMITFNTKYHWIEPVLSRRSDANIFLHNHNLFLFSESSTKTNVIQDKLMIEDQMSYISDNLVHSNGAEYIPSSVANRTGPIEFKNLEFTQKDEKILLRDIKDPNLQDLSFSFRWCAVDLETVVTAAVKIEGQDALEILLKDKLILNEEETDELFIDECRSIKNHYFGINGKHHDKSLVLSEILPGQSMKGTYGMENEVLYKFDDGTFDHPRI